MIIDTYEDNNQDLHNDIWTTQYSHFTLDEVGKDVDANSPTWWPPTRSSSPPTGTGLSRESPEAWLRELHIRGRDPRELSGGVGREGDRAHARQRGAHRAGGQGQEEASGHPH